MPTGMLLGTLHHVSSSKSLTATEAALQLCTYIAAPQGARDCTAEPRAWPIIRCAISVASVMLTLLLNDTSMRHLLEGISPFVPIATLSCFRSDTRVIEFTVDILDRAGVPRIKAPFFQSTRQLMTSS